MSRLLIAMFLLLAAAPSWAEPMSIPPFTWESPVKFGAIQEAGPDAYFAVYPADAEHEKAQLEFLLVHTPRESVATIREAGTDPKKLALATFFGVSERPEQINKSLFMGGTEAHMVYRTQIPRSNTLHVFQKIFSDDSMVTVALRDYGGVKPALVGDVLRAIADTFKSTNE